MRSAATMGELRVPAPNLAPRETVIPHTVAPKEKVPRLVTPEARTEVQSMLSARKQELEAAQKRLAWNLEQGDRIRLDELSHDYSGEIQRYQSALDALNQGNAAQARVILEKQVCHNLLSKDDMIRYQQETTTQYSQAGKILTDARSRLTVNPNDKMNLANLDQLEAAVDKMLLKQIYSAHPDWQNSTDPQIIALKNAEVVRLKNMLSLTTPEQLLAQADKLTRNPQDAQRHLDLFTQIQYKELQMLREHRTNMDHIIGAHNQFDIENLQLEAMITRLGGQASYDPERQARQQQFVQQMMMTRETDPAKQYNILMTSCKNSPQIAEQRMVVTYRELQKQRLVAESSIQNLEAKLKQVDLKPGERTKAERSLRLARLERSRISLVSWRQTEVYQLFKEKQKGKVYPTLSHLSAEYQQKELTPTPKAKEWAQRGSEWKKLADEEKNIPAAGLEQLQQRIILVKQKEKIIQEIVSRRKDIIEQQWSQAFNRDAPQPYYYLIPKAYNQAERSRLLSSGKGVNEAQDSLMEKLQMVGADAAINTPTSRFREKFPDVEKIAQERKIHLMPQLVQQPEVVDRLLALMEKQPALRDQISCIKVRVEGNGNADGLPEIVIYTGDEQFSQVLNQLVAEFSDIRGSGIVPRYNQEVANGLIYYAQSGGDLKANLRANLGTGVLKKVFDPKRNFAELRV